MGTFYVGTSGFAYREWKGPFYPPSLRAREMLAFYGASFRTVEINYTFRRLPDETVLHQWRRATPDGFLFTLKAHRLITHWLRLSNADPAVAAFLDRARLLGPRLGPILFQCPPNLRYDRALLDSFLSSLPPTFRYAFEFRHESWTQARELLADQGAAWCVADTDQQPFSGDRLETTPFAYLRLRKTRYARGELRSWATRISEAVSAGSDVFCYIKHEEKGTGPILARRLASLMTVEQNELPRPTAVRRLRPHGEGPGRRAVRGRDR